MKSCFIAIFNNRCTLQFERIRAAEMRDKLGALRGRIFVKKWKARANKTKLCRSKLVNFQIRNDRRVKSICFYFLKRDAGLKSQIFKKLLNVSDALNKEALRASML